FDRFIDVQQNSDRQAAQLVRSMEADFVVDLMGFTGDCRPGILALRPAPIQVNYLGFPGTMAAPYIDGIIADRTVIPDEERGNYREEIVALPNCYLPADPARAIASAPSRSEAGLPESAFVFVSFNNSYKYAPGTFAIWMQLLSKVEKS